MIGINLTTSSTNVASCFAPPPHNLYFVGRTKELEEIKGLFTNPCPPKLCVVSGIGGQGKTELCRQFCKNFDNKLSPPTVTWLNGSNGSILESSIRRLAQSLQIPISNEGAPVPFNEIIVKISDKITAKSSNGWVVVIDDVDETYEELKSIQIIEHCAFVLITSRRADILLGETKLQINLDVLDKDDAMRFVRIRLSQPQTDADIEALCQELGNHALALRQAVYFINAQQELDPNCCGIRDFIDIFTQDCPDWNLLQDIIFEDWHDKNIYKIVNRTMAKIQENHGPIGQKAAKLMEILSLMKSEGIPVECFKKFLKIVKRGDQNTQCPAINGDLHQSLLLLKRYCIISYSDKSNIFIHRLVQKFTKSAYSKTCIVTIVKGTNPKEFSEDELQQLVIILGHADIELFMENAQFYLRILARMNYLGMLHMETSEISSIEEIIAHFLQNSSLRLEVGEVLALFRSNDFQRGIPKLREWIDKLKSVLGREEPLLVSSFDRLNLKLSKSEDVFHADDVTTEVGNSRQLMNDIIFNCLSELIRYTQQKHKGVANLNQSDLIKYRKRMQSIMGYAAKILGKGIAFPG